VRMNIIMIIRHAERVIHGTIGPRLRVYVGCV